jgi:hypothetical protein
MNFNIWAYEGTNGGTNATITTEVYQTDNAGAILSTIVSVATNTELGTSAAAKTWNSPKVNRTELLNGQRLLVKIFFDNVGTMINGRSVYVNISSGPGVVNGDSWVRIGEGLAPAYPSTTSITGVYTSSITADWQLIRGATGYTLAASLSPGLPPAVVRSSTTRQNNAILVDLSTNTTYYLFVRSNGLGASGSWAAYAGTSTLANVPAAPVFNSVNEGVIQFGWDRNENPDLVTRYRVLSSTVPDPATFPAGAVVVSSDTYDLSLSSSGLNANTTYYFQDRKSTRLNSSHPSRSRMPSSA